MIMMLMQKKLDYNISAKAAFTVSNSLSNPSKMGLTHDSLSQTGMTTLVMTLDLLSVGITSPVCTF
jgi:hypothetical protein